MIEGQADGNRSPGAGPEHDPPSGRLQGVREVIPRHIRPEPQPEPAERVRVEVLPRLDVSVIDAP